MKQREKEYNIKKATTPKLLLGNIHKTDNAQQDLSVRKDTN